MDRSAALFCCEEEERNKKDVTKHAVGDVPLQSIKSYLIRKWDASRSHADKCSVLARVKSEALACDSFCLRV